MFIGNRQNLSRNYYNDDVDGFYISNTPIDCWEQTCYQTLRVFNEKHRIAVDHHIIFCNDITPNIYYADNRVEPTLNTLGIIEAVFSHKILSNDFQSASFAMEKILVNDGLVIFQTMFDCLKTCCWYKEEGPYNQNEHHAMILGYDSDKFYYLDVPSMKNTTHFVAYPENPNIGFIMNDELNEAFKLFCTVGYIDINETELNSSPDLRGILIDMLSNYENSKVTCSEEYIHYSGKKALKKITEELRINTMFDIFWKETFEISLFAARCDRLINNILKYPLNIKLEERNNIISILRELSHVWKIVKSVAEKNILKPYPNFNEYVLRYIEKIQFLTERFFLSLSVALK